MFRRKKREDKEGVKAIATLPTIKENEVLVEFYPISPPFAYAAVVRVRGLGRYEYRVLEPPLTIEDKKAIEEIKRLIISTAKASIEELKSKGVEEVLEDEIKRVVKKYKVKVRKESWDKVVYYIKRDMLGYGKLDVMMKDEYIEDISCDGVGVPVFVWHSKYESMPSNVVFNDPEELISTLIRLSYKAGKQISVAQPIVEGSLPEGYRIHLTLSEVSRRGGTFTIRKFRRIPFSVVDLIELGTLSPLLAAYYWVLIEEGRSIMIVGATASGKTTTLNAIAAFIRPEAKIVTIEETPELNLPHENWIPLITRPSHEEWVRNVDLFDLLKSALRMRPDYIIVGEIRGAEAFTLFQAIATGHSGLCTMHAENVDYAVKRLMAEPMNVPLFMLTLMNTYSTIKRIKLGGRIVRRIVEVKECVGIDVESGQPIFREVFRYNPARDDISFVGDSEVLKRIADLKFKEYGEILREMERRRRVLDYMVRRGMRNYRDIAKVIREYYYNPDRVYRSVELGVL